MEKYGLYFMFCRYFVCRGRHQQWSLPLSTEKWVMDLFLFPLFFSIFLYFYFSLESTIKLTFACTMISKWLKSLKQFNYGSDFIPVYFANIYIKVCCWYKMHCSLHLYISRFTWYEIYLSPFLFHIYKQLYASASSMRIHRRSNFMSIEQLTK